MNNIFKFLKIQLKYFFINPFWKNFLVLTLIVISIILNVLVWYFYLTKFKSLMGLNPIIFSSGILLLNIFLADIIFPKENLASFALLGTGLLIETLFLIFFRFIVLTKAF